MRFAPEAHSSYTTRSKTLSSYACQSVPTAPRRPTLPARRASLSPPRNHTAALITLFCHEDTTPQLADFLAPFYAAYIVEERGHISVRERLWSDVNLKTPASIENLVVAASGIFSVEVVLYLQQYYASADKAACDQVMACRTTVDVCLDILDQIREGCHHWATRSASSGDGGVLSGRHGGPGVGDAGLGSQGGGGRGRGASRGGERGGHEGRGGTRGRGGRGGGGRPGRPPRETPFTSVGIHMIEVPPRTTPLRPVQSQSQRTTPSQRTVRSPDQSHTAPHPDQSHTAPRPERQAITDRCNECQRQAIAFAQGICASVMGENLLPFSYILQEQYAVPNPEASSAHGTLYHATRFRHLHQFQRYGVDPGMLPHPNFFSKAPSFNLCTCPEQAISHVLHGTPTVRINGVLCDPIVVLAFHVNMASFWEHYLDYVAVQDAKTRLNMEDTMWVRENLEAEGKGKMEAEGSDFIVGPWLVPLTNRDDVSFMVSSYEWTRNKEQPLHIAAVSMEACNWLTQSIAAVFVEKETQI
ncbi:hypothetical protein GGX14DRAFT_389391 [Mycena pura]|uniref:Uncharacterized protein n=1 Tax=Mycena pura TaxID=153505 RepID=A0AAD6YKG1_9AGAR|nr:hypothetical protein GGX14DRAFT_389391 [Mycena pura]